MPVTFATVPAPTDVSTVGVVVAVPLPPLMPMPRAMLPIDCSDTAPVGDAFRMAEKPTLRPPSAPFPAANAFTVGFSSAYESALPPEKPRLAPKPLPSAVEVSVAVAVNVTSPLPPSTCARSPTNARTVGSLIAFALVSPPAPISEMLRASTFEKT